MKAHKKKKRKGTLKPNKPSHLRPITLIPGDLVARGARNRPWNPYWLSHQKLYFNVKNADKKERKQSLASEQEKAIMRQGHSFFQGQSYYETGPRRMSIDILQTSWNTQQMLLRQWLTYLFQIQPVHFRWRSSNKQVTWPPVISQVPSHSAIAIKQMPIRIGNSLPLQFTKIHFLLWVIKYPMCRDVMWGWQTIWVECCSAHLGIRVL
jgi:hypothetical protein